MNRLANRCIIILIFVLGIYFKGHSQVVVELTNHYNVETNEEVIITMSISGLGDINPLGIQGTLNFDSELLEYVSFSTVQSMPGIQVSEVTDHPDKRTFLWSIDFGNSEVTNGNLIEFTFKYLGTVEQVSLFWNNEPTALLVFDDLYNQLPAEWIGGEVVGKDCTSATIITQPSAQTLCINQQNIQLNVIADGDAPISYQWQFYNGTEWINVVDGTPEGTNYLGENASLLTVSGYNDAGVYQYKCLISNCGGETNIETNEVLININSLPNVTCPDNFTVTENQAITLTGVEPAGGVYSGTGVTNGEFNPEGLANGNYTITYTYIDGNDCENSCEFVITVEIEDFPDLVCPGNIIVCIDDEEFELTGATPSGGGYSGPGVIDGTFNPASAGDGTHTITYNVNEEECNFSITVNPLPNVTCPDNFTVTENQSITLTGAEPAGGVYSGTGVTNGEFNPEGLANGNYTITYTYVDGNDCENSCEFVITVNIEDFPDIVCPDDISICENTPAFTLSGAMPSGGTYSGTGVSGGIFSPAEAGCDTHTITYSYNEESCDFTITVNCLPEVTCPGNFTVTENEIVTLTGAEPTGGIYSGTGVTGGEFNPDGLANDMYIITYTYTDPGTGCSNFCQFVIVVDIDVNITDTKTKSISIYPNPNKGAFIIDFNDFEGKLQYSIYDSKGSIILNDEFISYGNKQKEINLDITSGIYFIKLVSNDNVIIEKIVVK